MSSSACVKHHAKIKRINITNSIFIRYFANEFCFGNIYNPIAESNKKVTY